MGRPTLATTKLFVSQKYKLNLTHLDGVIKATLEFAVACKLRESNFDLSAQAVTEGALVQQR